MTHQDALDIISELSRIGTVLWVGFLVLALQLWRLKR